MQRAAFIDGAAHMGAYRPNAKAEAKRRYPLPMIEKPRVIARTLSNSPLYNTPREIHLSIKDGTLVHGWGTCPNAAYDTFKTLTKREEGKFTAVDIRVIADAYAELKANPTELVEDDSE